MPFRTVAAGILCLAATTVHATTCGVGNVIPVYNGPLSATAPTNTGFLAFANTHNEREIFLSAALDISISTTEQQTTLRSCYSNDYSFIDAAAELGPSGVIFILPTQSNCTNELVLLNTPPHSVITGGTGIVQIAVTGFYALSASTEAGGRLRYTLDWVEKDLGHWAECGLATLP